MADYIDGTWHAWRQKHTIMGGMAGGMAAPIPYVWNAKDQVWSDIPGSEFGNSPSMMEETQDYVGPCADPYAGRETN